MALVVPNHEAKVYKKWGLLLNFIGAALCYYWRAKPIDNLARMDSNAS